MPTLAFSWVNQNKYIDIRMRYCIDKSSTVQIICENTEILVHLRNLHFLDIYPNTSYSLWFLNTWVAARSLYLSHTGSLVCVIIRGTLSWQTMNIYLAICPQNALHPLNVLQLKLSDSKCLFQHFSTQQVRLYRVISIV